MARSFGATTDRITQGSVAIPTTGSLSLWVFPNWAQADSVDHVFFDVRIVPATSLFTIQKYLDNTIYAGWYTSSAEYRVSVASASYTLNQSRWNHFCLTWDDVANVTKLYLNGSQIGSSTATLVTWSTATRVRYIGNYNPGESDKNLDGRIAEVAIWSHAHAADDITALSKGYSADQVCRASLVDYLPLVGRGNPEPNRRSGDPGTISSGTAAADHPRIIRLNQRKRGRQWAAAAAAGVTVPALDEGMLRGGLQLLSGGLA